MLFLFIGCAEFAFPEESYQKDLIQKAHQKNLADNPSWHRLLHYRRTLFGVYQSEINDPSFFLSRRGRKDPGAELDSTLKAFFDPPPSDPDLQHPQCRFPARYAWLKEELQFNGAELPEVSCLRFEKWRAQMDPASVTLVFASSYMNNPASMYGHTFLRLNGKTRTSRERLLDYAVNFAADLEADNGFLFALKGLLGGYHGRFSTMPYYMKVQEYNNLESRDLWEYDLQLPPKSLERLMQHLWEMGNVRVRYFFLNKNCSYYLLPLLEAAEPSLRLKDGFVFKAVPVDTTRAILRQPGVLAETSRRPSHTSKMLAARARLSPAEIRLAEKLAVIPAKAGIQKPWTPASVPEQGTYPSYDQERKGYAGVTTLEQLSPERRAMLLDSAHDLFRYRVGFKRDQPKEVQEKERQLLLLRNVIPAKAGIHKDMIDPDFPPSSAFKEEGLASIKNWSRGRRGDDNGVPIVAPHLGHKTGRIKLSYGFSNRSHFEELSLRPAIHDPNDPPEGFLPGSELEMFHLKLRYDNDRETLYVQQFALADLVSITPWDRWIHPPSWKVNTGLRVANDLNRDPENSLYYGLNLGTGYSGWGLRSRRVLLYGMADMDLGLGHAFESSIRFGGGPVGGVLFSPCRFWRARLQISHTEYAVGGTPSATKLALHQSLALTQDLELRATLERQNRHKEVLLGLAWLL